MLGEKSTRVLLWVVLIALGCSLNVNAADKTNQEQSRRMADDRNDDGFQFEPLKRQLMDFAAFRNRLWLTMRRLPGATERWTGTTYRPSKFGRHNSWGSTLN